MEVIQFGFQDSSPYNFPELSSCNISKGDKNFFQWLELITVVNRRAK
jgi:uncharacterized protein involved in tolerance to divalent cations